MATFYTDPNGDDTTGDGSIGSPWFNIQHAVANSGTADTIIINDGTYLITFTSEPGDEISFQNRTVRSSGGNPYNCILDFQNVVATFQGTLNGSFTGITFKNGSSLLQQLDFEIVDNCIFDEMTGSQDGSSSATRAGLFLSCSTRFRSCIFNKPRIRNNGSIGSLFTIRTGDLTTTILENCTIYIDNQYPAGFTEFNYLFQTRSEGGVLQTIDIKNTIIVNDGRELASGYFRITANGLIKTENSYVFNCSYAQGETGVSTDDPQLVDRVNGNYNLKGDSPCIGSGGLT